MLQPTIYDHHIYIYIYIYVYIYRYTISRNDPSSIVYILGQRLNDRMNIDSTTDIQNHKGSTVQASTAAIERSSTSDDRTIGAVNSSSGLTTGSAASTVTGIDSTIQLPPPPPQSQPQIPSYDYSSLLSSLPENRFELELEFIQALASPAYIHFLATSRTLDDTPQLSSAATASTTSQSTLQQLQPFLRYLYRTYSQPEYARFLRYPHALYFLESLIDTNSHDDTTDPHYYHDTTTTTAKKLWVEWTVPSFRNFCHQQQFLAWQHRHASCYGVGGITMVNAVPTNRDDNDPNSNDEYRHQDDTNRHQEVQPDTASVDDNDDMDDEDDIPA